MDQNISCHTRVGDDDDDLSFWILGLCMELAPFVSVFDARDSCVLCCLCL